jgi:hypothetical protein
MTGFKVNWKVIKNYKIWSFNQSNVFSSYLPMCHPISHSICLFTSHEKMHEKFQPIHASSSYWPFGFLLKHKKYTQLDKLLASAHKSSSLVEGW